MKTSPTKVFKFKPREEVLYYWESKKNHYRAIILKQLHFEHRNTDNNRYSIRVLHYQDGNWTLTVQESSLSKIENPNQIMKDLI